MPFSHLPPLLTSTFSCLASWLHSRPAARLPHLLLGVLFATGRRTVTSWFRAAGITDDFRPAYTTVCAVGRHVPHMAISTFLAVKPLLSGPRLTVAIDDTPTPRYGPEVEGAGIHHNPALAPLARSTSTATSGSPWPPWPSTPTGVTIALPLQAQLYIRQLDLSKLPRERRRPFRTKLQMAAEQLHWLRPWAASHFEELWSVVDGGYAKQPFLRAAKQENFIVVSRLRKDAALWTCLSRCRPRSVVAAGHRPTAKSGSVWPSGPGTTRLAASGMRAVRREGGQDDQDVPGDLASGRGCDPRGAGPGGGWTGCLTSRPTRPRRWWRCWRGWRIGAARSKCSRMSRR